MSIRNFITLFVTIEFDRPVDPDAVRRWAALTLETERDVEGSPTVPLGIAEISTRLAE